MIQNVPAPPIPQRDNRS